MQALAALWTLSWLGAGCLCAVQPWVQPVRTQVSDELTAPLEPRPFIGALAHAAALPDIRGRRPHPAAGDAQNTTSKVAKHQTAQATLRMDPAAYALYNPDFNLSELSREGRLSAEVALEHYERVGRHVGRHVFCTRLPVLLRYFTSHGGLTNVMLISLNAWILAAALGADVALPMATRRDSFASRQSRQGRWHRVPFGSVFHTDALVDTLSELGVRSAVEPFKFKTATGHDVPSAWHWVDIPRMSADGRGINYPLEELVRLLTQEAVKAATAQQAARLQRGHSAPPCDQPLVVELAFNEHMLFGSLLTVHLPLAGHLARRLRFSEAVEERARFIAGAMAARGYTQWNGLHLRIEGDKMDTALGNRSAAINSMLHRYKQLIRRMGGWGPDVPVYVASGLFSYAEGERLFMQAVAELRPVAGTVFLHKELYTSGLVPPALDSEQDAAVDQLLLRGAARFVGSKSTSMSWHVAQQRLLAGRSPRETGIVGYEPAEVPEGRSVGSVGMMRARSQRRPFRAAQSFLAGCPVFQCAHTAQLERRR